MKKIQEELRQHRQSFLQRSLLELFASERERTAQWTFQVAGIYADLSKNHVDAHCKTLFAKWLDARGIASGISAIARGENVNISEQRPALHHLLRQTATHDFILDNVNISAQIRSAHAKIKTIAAAVSNGEFVGYDGKAIEDVVHIGIGGSELGPRLLCEAFAHNRATNLKIHFLASCDAFAIAKLKEKLNPATTLLIIASKSFGTEETLQNANYMRQWLRHCGGENADKQMIAISANIAKATAFGIASENILPFWDWVGGRFSLWSSIALPFVLQNGYPAYQQLLSGANLMDEHFYHTDLMDNLPVQLALIDAWYNHYFNFNNRAIISYAQPLRNFSQYLQQLEMESLGKRSTIDGKALAHPSGMIIWGGSGTEAQHAFFQLIHQGQRDIPVDFIAVKKALPGYEKAAQTVLGHCLAQAQALMRGRAESDMQDGVANGNFQRTCAGNRCSNMLIIEELNAQNLGALLALYEHKTTVLGLLYNVNAYDQWGVELGKILAQQMQISLQNKEQLEHDPSTKALLKHLRDD